MVSEIFNFLIFNFLIFFFNDINPFNHKTSYTYRSHANLISIQSDLRTRIGQT
jgi:hypothetical protein